MLQFTGKSNLGKKSKLSRIALGKEKLSLPSMIEITLPDGSIKSVEAGTTALDIATGISEGLARNVLAEVAGRL